MAVKEEKEDADWSINLMEELIFFGFVVFVHIL